MRTVLMTREQADSACLSLKSAAFRYQGHRRQVGGIPLDDCLDFLIGDLKMNRRPCPNGRVEVSIDDRHAYAAREVLPRDHWLRQTLFH